MKKIDVTLLTDARFVQPVEMNWYTQNILDDDKFVQQALEKRGLTVVRMNWDSPAFDWTETRCAIFRTTWDYFDRFAEFSAWLDTVSKQTQLINPIETIRWNVDKHYLKDLAAKRVNIPTTVFIEIGDKRTLQEVVNATPWSTLVLKPAISGAARHTYKFTRERAEELESVFQQLIHEEAMLLQEFQHRVLSKGEVALVVLDGQYSHAVLKMAKPGDFRVQDDFGGTLHSYIPSLEEVHFAEDAVRQVNPLPTYARVDIIWDNENQLCLSELELIEPELWFRRHPPAADLLAEAVVKRMDG